MILIAVGPESILLCAPVAGREPGHRLPWLKTGLRLGGAHFRNLTCGESKSFALLFSWLRGRGLLCPGKCCQATLKGSSRLLEANPAGRLLQEHFRPQLLKCFLGCTGRRQGTRRPDTHRLDLPELSHHVSGLRNQKGQKQEKGVCGPWRVGMQAPC